MHVSDRSHGRCMLVRDDPIDFRNLTALLQRIMPASFNAGQKRPRPPGNPGQPDFGQFRFSGGSAGMQQQHSAPGKKVRLSQICQSISICGVPCIILL